MRSKSSEIILLAILGLLVGFTRVYYGSDELIFVWKGEFGYQDTIVNLPQIQTLSRAELARAHPGVLYQLEEMGLYESADNLNRINPPRKPQTTLVPPPTKSDGVKDGTVQD